MKIVNVRIKYGGQVMAYECGELSPALGDWVVVKCGDQSYMGQVVTAPVIWMYPQPVAVPDEDENFFERPAPSASGSKRKAPKEEPRRMLRLATPADMDRQADHELREREAFDYCHGRVEAHKLEMKLVAVEVVFDGSKTIFYYTAEERVDFRQLVKELVSRFRTRIEMRQIGVRHEARMVGGLGVCGRSFCCSGFLSNFAPVSVKMAKEQNVSLSPAKISGVCGRLMCCLAFEHYGPVERGSGSGSLPSGE